MNKLLHRIATWALFLTAALGGLMGLIPKTMAAPHEAGITAEQLREDIRFIRTTIAQTHPDLRFSVDPAAVEKAYDTLTTGTGAAMTRDEAWRHLATLNPLFADGHLLIGYPGWRADTTTHLNAGGSLFPYEIELRNGGVVIRGLLGGAETPLVGTRIIAINGEPIEKIRSVLLDRIHGDTPLFRSTLLGQRWWFYYWKMFGAASSYRLTVARGDHTWTLDTAGSRETPLFLRNESGFDQQFRLAFQPDGSAVLTVASFAPADRQQFLAFTRDAFTKLRQARTALLLIDISTNGGGDDAPWLEGLMPYLATKPYRTASTYKKKVIEANAERAELPGQVVAGTVDTWHLPQPDNPLLFRGKTQVLIGPATYSSAILFANVMHDFGFGTLVGQGGAARRTQSGGVRQFILPNSKLALWVPRFVLVPPAGTAPGEMLEP